MTQIHIKSISELNKALNQGCPKHPLISVVDFTRMEGTFEHGTKISTEFYSVMFKNYCANKIRYGMQPCDFEEGSLICIAPRQVITFDGDIEHREDKMGWGLFFHPDLFRGSSLHGKMKDYTFFSYETAEALHLSDKEKQVLKDCILKIETELNENIDHHSQTLMISNIELLLNYCARYYGRQFITRKHTHSSIVARVEKILTQYFRVDSLKEKGLPKVKYIADQVHLSANYLSDLLKKETGMNTQDHIHYYLIEEAKSILLTTNKSVNEVAYVLGFEYPQYFSKLFKRKTGKTPVEYRNLN